MKPVIHSIFVFSFICLQGMFAQSFAQQNMVKYERGFSFREGVYFTFLDFKNNNPIPTAKIISNYNKSDRSFISSILDKPSFKYLDGFGKETIMKSDDAWGYCSNGTIYINHGTDFNRVTIIGSMCHFLATIPMRIGASDPFYYNQPFGTEDRYTYVTEQFIVDMESGRVMSFNVGNIEALLSRDEVLHTEFTALKKRKKRDAIFLYLRKYNEKYPVYFPK